MTDIVKRLRFHIAIRGGPAKDDDGNYVGTTWPMILEAADEIERLRAAQPQYLSNCLRAGACHGICESTACTNYGKDIVVRRCVETKQDGVVYPGVEK